MNRTVLFWFALLLVLSGAVVFATAWKLAQRKDQMPEPRIVTVPDAPPGSDAPILQEFTLTERSGKPLSSRNLLGEVWVASFFFASCPGSCRAQNLELLTLQNEFAKKGVKFVSITCDPRTDTPEKLRVYAESYQAMPDAWYFLTGDLKYTRRIGAEIFGVWVDERGHMDRFMTVDKWGNVRGHFDWKDKAKLAELKSSLGTLLAETAPPADLKRPRVATSATDHAPADAETAEQDTAAAADETAEAADDDGPAQPAPESGDAPVVPATEAATAGDGEP